MKAHRDLFFDIDPSGMNEADATVPVTISTETPVRRVDPLGQPYNEVLSHAVEAIDLTRAPLPVLEQHDSETLNIGVVEGLVVSGDRLRGLLRLGMQERARQLWADIKAGIVRNLSIGYEILDSVAEDGRTLVTRWAPYEVSLVSVPADPNAGIGRSKTMPDNDTQTTNVATLTTTQWQDKELDRREGIEALFRMGENQVRHDSPRGESYARLRQRCLFDPRMTEARARDELLAFLSSEPHQSAAGGFDASYHRASMPGPAPDMSQRHGIDPLGGEVDLRGYSIIDAVLIQCDPNYGGGGFEREVSQELIKRTGIKPRHGGLMMPATIPAKLPATATRELVWGGGTGSGADLIGTAHRPDLWIDVLRNRSVTLAMGAVMQTGLVQNQSIPKKAAAGSVGWYDLDGTAQIVADDMTLAEITMEPHQLAGIQGYSWRLLRQGLPATEQLIRQDLAGSVAEEIDRTVLQGSGAGAEPAGLSVLAASKPTYTAGALAYSDIVGLEDAVYAANGDTTGSLGFVVASDLVGTLKSTEKIASGGQPIAEGAGGDGMLTMSGYPVRHTNGQVSASITFGSWSQCWIAQWGGVELLANPYEKFAEASVSIRIIADHDIAVRHPESFGYLTTV